MHNSFNGKPQAKVFRHARRRLRLVVQLSEETSALLLIYPAFFEEIVRRVLEAIGRACPRDVW